ncbi:hypothetical protein P7F60_03045 [Rhizobium sp. YJ-22]|uniref:EF-hand domain-containing protein n=1 Tax=Rhizobium sp. YJ-22 TaxID=3037556 RepID=UPI002412B8E7|nr:hypothetical protein [Rhizobium sp. YJ-22]MDG3575350.1 hypothetical protein [Rhizobium sp. YJ-22]
MNGKKIMLTGLSAALVLGVAAEAFAAPRHHGPRMAPEVLFVRMLKQDDANKDGRITPEEAKTGAEKLFAAIDTNNDGNITPGEMRAYHKAKREERKAEWEKMKAERETAQNDDDKDGKKPGRHHGDRDGMGRHGMKWGSGEGMIFRIADKDENGQISKDEYMAAADKLFKRMDRNKDGVISIDDMPNR